MKEFLQSYQLFSVIFLICMAFAAIARTLGVIGLAAVQGRHLWSITAFYLFLISIFLLMYLFSGIGRFRAPLEPILMLYAAVGISFIFRGRTPRGGRS